MSLRSWFHSKKRLVELNGSMSNVIFDLRRRCENAEAVAEPTARALSQTRAKMIESERQIAGLKSVVDAERKSFDERGEELAALESRLNVALAQLKTERRRSAAYKGRMK